MRWDIDENIRCTLFAFTGLNLSGNRSRVRVFPSGVDGKLGSNFRSITIVAPVGVRVILMTASSEDNAFDMPWRAIEIRKGKHFKLESGSPAVNIPDLDLYEEYDAERIDPDFVQTYAHVSSPDERPDWTYGMRGDVKLKNSVHAIKVEWIDKPVKKD